MTARSFVLVVLSVPLLACGGRSRTVGSATEEPAAPPAAAVEDPAVPEGAPAPVESKRPRYRSGGGSVRAGDRAVELHGAVHADGTRVSLESYPAPVLVLTFGASWCVPCKKELPALEKLAAGYDPAAVTFVAVNVDKTLAKGKGFMSALRLARVQAVYDPQQASVGSYDPPTMPSLFVVNQGIVKYLHAGFKAGDEAKLKDAIDRELR